MNKISLNEAKKIKLFNRVEKKFICDSSQLFQVLEHLKNWYIVTENEETFFEYHSLYFDTSSLDMFNDHENSVNHRQKIRIREYSDSEKFLEIKDKEKEKGITRKSRIPVDSYELDGERQWIDKNLIYDTSNLKKTLDVRYKRMTLISEDKSIRMTIDKDICFYNYQTKISDDLSDIIVIEIKQPNPDNETEIEEFINSIGIYKTKFSKYHIGIKMTKEES